MIFRSVRAQLIGLVLCVVLPIGTSAIFIAYDHYQSVARGANRWVWLTAHTVAARYTTVIAEARNSLVYAGSVILRPGASELGRSTCPSALSDAMGLSGHTFRGIALLGADGTEMCVAGTGVKHADIKAQQITSWDAAGAPFVSDMLGARWVFTEGEDLNVVVPLVAGGHLAALLMASIDVGSFARQPLAENPDFASLVWLADKSDHLFVLSGSADQENIPRPLAATMDLARMNADSPVSVTQEGKRFDYARVALTNGVDVWAGIPLQHELARAWHVFMRQSIEICALLLVGLAAAATGVNYAVAHPLNDVTLAIRKWRNGGKFEFAAEGATGGRTRRLPSEIQELASAFGQAVTTLDEREHQLSQAKSKQELLMQEIHHRVKNNLQIIASLLNLQASRIRLPEAKAEFQSARDRIRALATLHRHLYAHGEIHTINMRGFLSELCEQLLQAIGEKPSAGSAGRRIKLNIEATELQISSDQAVPMALIVTEAVSNAAKYAFPGGRSGSINVKLIEEADLVTLIIEDDGVGIPAGRAETETGIRDGIGLQLIRGFARQLGGTLTVIESNGTRYELQLRAHPTASQREGTQVAESVDNPES